MGLEVMRKIKAKDRTWRVIGIQTELKNTDVTEITSA